jgi:hypothetical protein
MKDKVVFTFGRMQPATVGHLKLVDAIETEAKKQGADARIYLSHTQNKKKDPLSYDDKIKYATKAFGSIVTKSPAKTIIQVLKELESDGYTDATMIVGSDRVPEFDRLLTKYNGKDYKFDSIEVKTAGERDPDSDGVDGMSASKMRAAVKDGEYDKFKSGLPPKLSDADAKYLFKEIDDTLVESLDEGMTLYEDYLITYGLA